MTIARRGCYHEQMSSPAHERVSPEAARTLGGKFEIRRVVRRHNQMLVFEAEHLGIQRTVELRVIEDDDPGAAAALLRHARTAGRVPHRNVQSVVDTGLDKDGRPYLVLEWLEGPTLEQLLLDNPRGLGETRAVALGVQLLEALSAAHRAGVVHRNVCPSRIIVESVRGGAELVKLTDFDDAIVLDEGDAPRLSLPPSTVYQAEELRKGDADAGTSMDVFAAAVVLREMATGHPRPLREVSGDLRRAIDRGYARSLKERFADADAFLHALAIIENAETRGETDSLHADLRYLQRRRRTAIRSADNTPSLSVSHRTVLLTVEAIYKMLGKRWGSFAARCKPVNDLLPGSKKAHLYRNGVPIPLFYDVLRKADEVLGQGDLVLVATFGEAVGLGGFARIFPKLDCPNTPEQLAAKLPIVHNAIVTDGRAVLLEQEKNSAKLAVSEQNAPGLEFGAWFGGLLRGLLTVAGAYDIEVNLVANQALGDDSDIYALTWRYES